MKQSVKRILYTIRKKMNVTTKDMCFGQYNKSRGVRATLHLLKEKGLLFQDNSPLRGSSFQACYWLTPEGIKVADKIVKEVDEYKRW